jgi:hypothetical protein
MSEQRSGGARHGTVILRGLDTADSLRSTRSPAVSSAPVARGTAAEPFSLKDASLSPTAETSRFGRIFKQSSYFPSDGAIHALALSMRDPNPESPERDNPNIPLGMTFFAQFIDHNLTLDITPLFSMQQDPAAVADFRSSNLDLDQLYGGGPGVTRFLYDVLPPGTANNFNPVKLVLDPLRDFDLPRNSQNTAIIGDPRNDENFLVSQTHVAFIKFHNAIVDYLLATDPQKYVGEGANPTLFRDASLMARWHYQWIIVNEFLPKILGTEVVQEVLTHGRLWYRPAEQGHKYPYMPVEFSTAAYRLGHAMLRQHYVINDGFQANLFDMPVFGNPRIDASKKLDFTKFFDFPGKPAAQRARRYGAIITPPVFELPFIDPTDDPPIVLPERNMLRARLFKVPSGQEVATLMKNAGMNITVHSNQELGITAIPGTDGLLGQAPLWYYILKESEFAPIGGLHLGPVGGRIVAEVFIGILQETAGNYLHDQPDWKPTLSSARSGTFTLTDLLTFANA